MAWRVKDGGARPGGESDGFRWLAAVAVVAGVIAVLPLPLGGGVLWPAAVIALLAVIADRLR